MAKFRSWCEIKKRFDYFENGHYYIGDKLNYEILDGWNDKKWQNAEQSMVIDDEIFYKNDIGLLECYLFNCGKKEKTILKGIINFDIKGLYITTNNNKYYISNCLRFNEDSFKVIGNIHEKQGGIR